MQLTLQNNDDNSGQLTIVLEHQDYAEPFNRELKKKAGKMQLKGFRKGKAPVGMVKKLYGSSIFYDMVNQMLSERLNAYVQENNLDLIGNPLPVEDQEMYDFNPSMDIPMTFRFDLGWYPAFELKGVSNGDTYTMYELEIADADLDEEMEALRMRAAQPKETDEPIAAEDMIDVEATEANGDEPYNCTFKVRLEDIKDEAVKQQLIGKSKGAEFTFDIYTLEGGDRKHVRKYLLQLDEADEREPGPDFKGVVKAVYKKKPADIDEEFFSRFFGEETKTEKQAREMLREYMVSSYAPSVNGLLFLEIRDALLKNNPMNLSSAFISRMIDNLNKEGEKISADTEAYKDALIWMRMRDQLAEQFQVNVTEQDLDRHFQQQIYNYFGGAEYVFSIMDDMVKRMRSNQKMVNEAYHKLLDEKVFFAIKDAVAIEKKPIGLADFKAISEAKNKEAEATAE